jgi:SP family general alpha glucoside:H+ symporter-like MFS transporter
MASQSEPAEAVVHVDGDKIHKMSDQNPNIGTITREAAAATEAELQMSLWQSVKLYPKAVGWSVLLSCAIIMEGFDIVLMANLFAYPPFQKKFGQIQPDGTYQLTAAWQSGLSNGALVGEIIGLFANGIIAERFGYRYTMIGALSLCICFIFIIFFAQSLVQLLIGEILMGIPWGVFQVPFIAEYRLYLFTLHLTTCFRP